MNANGIDPLIEQLIEVLEQSETLYGRLLPIIQQEKEAALSSNVEQLTLASAEKERQMVELKGLDQRRTQLLHQIAQSIGSPFNELRLTTLAGQVQKPQGLRLRALNDSLSDLVARVRQANTESRALIQHCLRLVHSALGFFHHWMGSSSVYSASGSMDASVQTGGRLLSSSA